MKYKVKIISLLIIFACVINIAVFGAPKAAKKTDVKKAVTVKKSVTRKTKPIAAKPGISSIVFDKFLNKLYIDHKLQTKLNVKTTGKFNYKVSYRSLSPTIATVDNEGIVTGNSEGETSIIATINGMSAGIKIRVLQAKVTKAVINVPETMTVDDTAKVNVNITMEPSTVAIPEIKYSFDNSSIATVDSEGNITALENGIVNITATISNITTTAAININPKLVELEASANINPLAGKRLMIYEKSKIQIKEQTKPENQVVNISFKSSDNSIALVDDNGYVLGLKAGNVNIIVSAGNKNFEVPMLIYDLETDTDKDSLTDYYELHKYLTNPDLADSDKDGVPDGDWNERREFTYSLSSNLSVVPTTEISLLCNNVQDARIVKTFPNTFWNSDPHDERANTVNTIEIISYPFATNTLMGQELYGNSNWKQDNMNNPEMQRYLKAGTTTNYDEQMQKDLLAEINKYGIDPDKLTDIQLVKAMIKWRHDRNFAEIDSPGSTQYGQIYEMLAVENDGKVYFKDRYKESLNEIVNADNKKYNTNYTLDDILQRNIFGKSMYYLNTHGNCNTQATLTATVFKALGIPARIVVIDDAFLAKDINITSEVFKKAYTNGALTGVGHTYAELYVGGRWIKCDNFNNFPTGQNVDMIQYIPDKVDPNKMYELPKLIFQVIDDNINTGYDALSHTGGKYSAWAFSFDESVSDSLGQYAGKLIKQKANTNTGAYINSHIMVANGDILQLYSQKGIWMTGGGTGLTPEEIKQKTMLVILDNGNLDISPQIKEVFKGMNLGHKNFINVKIVGGQVLVYMKAEGEQKLEQLFNQLDESDLYTEQYINFDKQ